WRIKIQRCDTLSYFQYSYLLFLPAAKKIAQAMGLRLNLKTLHLLNFIQATWFNLHCLSTEVPVMIRSLWRKSSLIALAARLCNHTRFLHTRFQRIRTARLPLPMVIIPLTLP